MAKASLLQKWGNVLLLICGLIVAIPELYKLLYLWGLPILQVIVGIASVIVAVRIIFDV